MRMVYAIVVIICCVAGRGYSAERPPNILYIMADDQRFDTLGCTGNPVLETPNIDKLAENGTSFSQAFATTPICCVSRVCVLTGQTAPIREGGHPFNDRVMMRTPAGRWGEPEDIGNAALFLASRASQFVNGHVLYVDGGILANFGYVKGENEHNE